MRFRFQRRRDTATGAEPAAAEPRWASSGVADEIDAYLRGRLVDYLTGRGREIPAWAVLNRLAHADHDELVRLVGGVAGSPTPVTRRLPWAEAERFLAARLLADDGRTAEGLRRIQAETLVPLELSLVDRTTSERVSADGVLGAARTAVESRGSRT
jgi:hypothetical protein